MLISALLATNIVRLSKIVPITIVPKQYTSNQALIIMGRGDTMNVVINFGISWMFTLRCWELICLVM